MFLSKKHFVWNFFFTNLGTVESKFARIFYFLPTDRKLVLFLILFGYVCTLISRYYGSPVGSLERAMHFRAEFFNFFWQISCLTGGILFILIYYINYQYSSLGITQWRHSQNLLYLFYINQKNFDLRRLSRRYSQVHQTHFKLNLNEFLQLFSVFPKKKS